MDAIARNGILAYVPGEHRRTVEALLNKLERDICNDIHKACMARSNALLDALLQNPSDQIIHGRLQAWTEAAHVALLQRKL